MNNLDSNTFAHNKRGILASPKYQNTYTRVLNILKNLKYGDSDIETISEQINETEKDVYNELKKLIKIDGFPIEKNNDSYRLKSDFKGYDKIEFFELIAHSLASDAFHRNDNYKVGIRNLFKTINYGSLALPQREDPKYKEIENFESYELSYCIANEMAIRNKTIEKQIRIFYYTKDLLPKLSYEKLTTKLKRNSIAMDLKNHYWISVYHCEFNYYNELTSIEYAKDKINDLFAYNDLPVDLLLLKQFHFNNNEKNQLEPYKKIDFKNIMSNRNPDGFKLSQEHTNERQYHHSIIPDFHRKILDPNLVSVPLNFALPKSELLAYIEHIKDSLYPKEENDYKKKQVLTVQELIYNETYNNSDNSRRLPIKIKAKKIADYLYIYDYITKKINQLKNSSLKIKENQYKQYLKAYKKDKQTLIMQIEFEEFKKITSDKLDHLVKSMKSEEITSKDMIKSQYTEQLQLNTTYCCINSENYHKKTLEIHDLCLKDIDIIEKENIELLYKVHLSCIYIQKDLRFISKEYERINALPDYNNKNIQKYKAKQTSIYFECKKSISKTLKNLKLIEDELVKNTLVSDSANNEDSTQSENIKQMILEDKNLLKQLDQNSATTILESYYAIKPYIENYKYKELLSGVSVPEERKSNQEKIKDGRFLPQERQQQNRNNALKLIAENNFSVKDIANIVGVHESRIYEWKKLYNENKHLENNDVSEHLKIQKRGRKEGELLLNNEQQHIVIQHMINISQRDIHLWNFELIQALIAELTSINISLSAVRNYLNKWNFLVNQKKFVILHWKRKDFNIHSWIEYKYSDIQKNVREENAELWWTSGIYGTIVQSQIDSANKLRILNAAKGSKNIFSIFQLQHDDDIINNGVADFINFLEKILKNSNKKIYIIILNFTQNDRIQLDEWENAKGKKVKLFYLYDINNP